MSFAVTLSMHNSNQEPQSFMISDRMACLIGRNESCDISIPKTIDRSISRYHCLLDINPPLVTIHDLGSTNTTLINGEEFREVAAIQASANGESAADGYKVVLKSGDEILVGETVFRIELDVPVHCISCKCEIPKNTIMFAERKPGIFQCEECFNKDLAQNGGQSPSKRCVLCNSDVSNENHDLGKGEYLCINCRGGNTESVSELINQTLPGHKISRELNYRNNSSVYLITEEETQHKRILKIIWPGNSVEESSQQQFLKEMKHYQTLSHYNIARMYEVGYFKGMFYIVREYCEQGSLSDLVEAQGGMLPTEEACKLTFQILDGLEFAHKHQFPSRLLPESEAIDRLYEGILHCSLKPSNVLIGGSPEHKAVKISEFGLARALDHAGLHSFTQFHLNAASYAFISRHHLLYYKNCMPDVDVWSAAAILYYMLTGHSPRDFARHENPLECLLKKKPVPILERYDGVSSALAHVIDEALADNQLLRYQSVEEFRNALNTALS